MENIGKRIKQLRKQNDLTQEKLADYLMVSYQAVSKWETGATVPDISLIRPLTRLFHVSADDLLGITTQTEEELRREELKKRHKDTYTSGDLIERYKIAQQAVSEFPGDCEYMGWLADGEYFIAFEEEYRKELGFTFEEMMERSRRHYELVLEDCPEGEVRNSALAGIVMALSFLGRPEEGIPYAEQYPRQRGFSREDCLEWCYTGEALTELLQGRVRAALFDLCHFLARIGSDEAVDAWEKVIQAVIPDGNYVEFLDDMTQIKCRQTYRYAKAGDGVRRDEALAKAKAFAKSHDEMFYGDETYFDTPKVYRYTAPLLNLLSRDMRERCVSGVGTMTEEVADMERKIKAMETGADA